MMNMEADGEYHHSFAHSLFIQQTISKTFSEVGTGPAARATKVNRRSRSWPPGEHSLVGGHAHEQVARYMW